MISLMKKKMYGKLNKETFTLDLNKVIIFGIAMMMIIIYLKNLLNLNIVKLKDGLLQD